MEHWEINNKHQRDVTDYVVFAKALQFHFQTVICCFPLFQLPILASSVVSLYFLELTDVFKPVHSGFNCYDKSLSMPYIEPTQESVPFLMLLSLVFAGPSITVSLKY